MAALKAKTAITRTGDAFRARILLELTIISVIRFIDKQDRIVLRLDGGIAGIRQRFTDPVSALENLDLTAPLAIPRAAICIRLSGLELLGFRGFHADAVSTIIDIDAQRLVGFVREGESR